MSHQAGFRDDSTPHNGKIGLSQSGMGRGSKGQEWTVIETSGQRTLAKQTSHDAARGLDIARVVSSIC